MELDWALSIMASTLQTTLQVASPMLVVALVVGLCISIFQVVTQIQEMTLTFVPKIVAAVVTLAVFGHWMLITIVEFSITLISNIPMYIKDSI
ncbi:MAG: flagellar biosynthesis protein FliQ [Alteromonadaceae bacterium]|nr:flagellar biosynthesis protein FliQ [Alteromonadaceae bacterium]